MSIVFVSGVPGTGKSTVCQGALEQDYDLDYLNVGQYLEEYIEEHGSEEGVDDALEDYLKGLEDDVIVDTHAVERTDYGLKQYAFQGLSDMDVEGYVFVDSDPEDIYQRREKSDKERIDESLDEIEQHRDHLQRVITSRATRDEAPTYVL
ncbi:MAG: AAA family ATPase, partial [Candidatus Nanohaloarchaea archaeon]|nr:AAA family ATPase [Candidatus Nanohaloarchaea archaeon]